MAAVPIARADDALETTGARAATVAVLVLVAALVLARPSLVALAVSGVGALYGAELAIADRPLDVLAAAVAAGLLLALELGYWSIEERIRWVGEPGDGARRAALAALGAAAAFFVAAALLALVDVVRTTGLAVDVAGAAAAAAILVTVLALARAQPSSGS